MLDPQSDQLQVSSWPPAQRRSLSLIAVIGAAQRVGEVANLPLPPAQLSALDELLLGAAVNRNPQDWDALFPAPGLLAGSAKRAADLLQGGLADRQTLLYAMQLITLAERLDQQPAIRNALGDLLDSAEEPNPEQLGQIYQATISKLGHRIQVTGNPQNLQHEQTAQFIRALLLAGIRFAWLWRSQGGRRRHLVLGRRKLVKSIQVIGARI